MLIGALLQILNVNSLSQSFNGLIERLSLATIDFHSNLTCLLLPYLLSHFDAQSMGISWVFAKTENFICAKSNI